MRTSRSAKNPKACAYTLVEALDRYLVEAALDARRRRATQGEKMQSDQRNTMEERRAYLRFVIQETLGRPPRPSWEMTRHMNDEERRDVLGLWIEACADWDRANGARVERELDGITEAGLRMHIEGVPVNEMRCAALARARSLQP